MQSKDPLDFSDKFNTKLSPEEEAKYQEWATKTGKAGDVYDYDLRGAWKELNSGKMKMADNGHLGDKYKKPNHPTFSDQSIHSGISINGKSYIGGSWGNEDGKDTYTPSATNLEFHGEGLSRYFKTREPNVILKTKKGL